MRWRATRSSRRPSECTPPATGSTSTRRHSTCFERNCCRVSAMPSTSRPAQKGLSSPAAPWSEPMRRSTSCLRSRSSRRIASFTTGSDEDDRAARRERADAPRWPRLAAFARHRPLVAPARLPVWARLPVRHRARRDRLRALCTRACELWLDRARGNGRSFARVLRVASQRDRTPGVASPNRYDAWAIWALKGHALYAFGWADPVVFAGASYRFANLDYPLLLPSLEAVDFRAMGAFDTRLLHVQFLLFLVAAMLALFALLRDRVPSLVLWLSLFALALAPAVFDQLLTAYADVPLALVFGIGVGAAGRWVITNERWALALATFCFAGALLTKNEGSLFVLAVFLGLFVAAHARWRPLAVAGAVDLLLLLPWRIYVHSHHLRDINYSIGDSFDYEHVHSRLGVGPIAFRTLAGQMLDPQQWGLLVPIFVV